jgi:hypothetical protein
MPMMQAPMRQPSTLPAPPASEVPPMTAEAIAFISQPVPASAWADSNRATRMMPTMLAVGDNCFAAPKDVKPKDAANVAVRQGYEETSNVKLVDELVNMIMVSRLYEANMKLTTVNKDNTSSAISVAMG